MPPAGEPEARETSDQEVPVSTRADSAVGPRPDVAGYGQRARLGSPANPEFTKTTAAPGTKTSARKHNRRMRAR